MCGFIPLLFLVVWVQGFTNLLDRPFFYMNCFSEMTSLVMFFSEVNGSMVEGEYWCMYVTLMYWGFKL